MKATRSIAMILSLMLAIPFFSTETFAATQDTVRQYGSEENGGYLAIGDSIARGNGTDGYYAGQYYNYDCRNVEGSFPYIIAQAVGCTSPVSIYDQTGNFWPECYPGQTLGATCDLLGIEDNFTDTTFSYGNYDEMVDRFGCSTTQVGARGEYNTNGSVGQIDELIKRSSLITLEVGMCDVFYRPLVIATNGGSFAEGFEIDTENLEAVTEFVETYLKEMQFGFDYWSNYYPMLIQYIKNLNPNATIVMVGSFNMVSDMTLTDDMFIPIGTAVSAFTAAMNQKYSNWADTYGVIYADVSNTTTYATANGISFMSKEFLENTDYMTHPDQEGNAYMARQILYTLPEAEQEPEIEPETVSTDIVVDLGRFKKVNMVMLDGVPVTNYSMDGYVLTVPCDRTDAINLSVAIINEKNKISAQTYTLLWGEEGYQAIRTYGTNDLVGTALKPVENVFSTIKGISGIFK